MSGVAVEAVVKPSDGFEGQKTLVGPSANEAPTLEGEEKTSDAAVASGPEISPGEEASNLAWALDLLYRSSQPEGFRMEMPGFSTDVIADADRSGASDSAALDASDQGETDEPLQQEQGRGTSVRQFLRKFFIGFGATVAVLGYAALADLQITLNGSESLPEAAYLQWHWPKHLWRGAIVAFPPPRIFKDRLEGYSIIKRIGGLPGDPIRTYVDFTCVAGTCYPAEQREGRAFAPLIPGGVIPEGMVAVFGEAPNSLDSRYASFGLVPIDKIEAVGIALRGFPRWQEIATWLEVSH